MKMSNFLLPFAWIYGTIIHIRNLLYNIHFFKSQPSPIPSIVIGNLSMGGSGKTPMLLWIYNHLSSTKKIAFLSRGYGRKTKGFIQVTENRKPEDVGDEPLLIYSKTKNPYTFVCENRIIGIDKIKEKFPNIDLIILDDAFQHRRLKGDVNILLSDFNSPYFKDFFFPYGNLRDSKKEANRADIIVFTKVPENLTQLEKNHFIDKIKLLPNQSVFFSNLMYQNIQNAFTHDARSIPEECIVVSGIANPKPFINFLNSRTNIIKHFKYSDHHPFSLSDIKNWAKIGVSKNIITTEKDGIRLLKYKNEIKQLGLEILILPIEIEMDHTDLFFEKLNKLI